MSIGSLTLRRLHQFLIDRNHFVIDKATSVTVDFNQLLLLVTRIAAAFLGHNDISFLPLISFDFTSLIDIITLYHDVNVLTKETIL